MKRNRFSEEQIKREERQLEKLVAEQALDNEMLKALNAREW